MPLDACILPCRYSNLMTHEEDFQKQLLFVARALVVAVVSFLFLFCWRP